MRVLVTGAGGFLGGAISQMLSARGDQVRSLSRRAYPALAALGVEQTIGDLADSAAVTQAVRGCDAVVHVAALPGHWGSYQSYFQANVLGTQNVLNACSSLGISKLVYTSTPSVAHAGGHLGWTGQVMKREILGDMVERHNLLDIRCQALHYDIQTRLQAKGLDDPIAVIVQRPGGTLQRLEHARCKQAGIT